MKRIFVLLFMLVISLYSNTSYGDENLNTINTYGNSYENKNEQELEIKKVTENFLDELLTVDYLSGDDYSLIHSDSKLYKHYLKKRNELMDVILTRSKAPTVQGQTINNEKRCDFEDININGCYAISNLRVTESYNYVGEEDMPKASISYNACVILKKQNNNWRIWVADIDNELSNPLDSKYNIIKKVTSCDDLFSKNNYKKTIRKINTKNVTAANEYYEIDELYKKYIDEINESYDNIDKYNNLYNSIMGEDTFEDVTKLRVAGNVDRKKMLEYMELYAKEYNTEYKYFSNGDCANFGSQVLERGGATPGHSIYIDGKNRLWANWPQDYHVNRYGDAWAQAHYLVAFILRNDRMGPQGYKLKDGRNVVTGDMVFLHNGSRWFHTTIVTHGTGDDNPRISCHSPEIFDRRINTYSWGRNNRKAFIKISSLW